MTKPLKKKLTKSQIAANRKRREKLQPEVRDAADTIVYNLSLEQDETHKLYHPGFCHLVEQQILVGGQNTTIARLLGVSDSTIDRFIGLFPELGRAIKKARANADDEIQNSLYHRAKGYEHEAVKIFNDDGSPMTVKYTERYPPDTAAAFIWLKNRQSALWNDRRQIEVNTPADEAKRLIREELARVDGATDISPEAGE